MNFYLTLNISFEQTGKGKCLKCLLYCYDRPFRKVMKVFVEMGQRSNEKLQ